MAQTPALKPIYIHDNGEASCTDHGGMYLAAAAKRSPKARNLSTPRGTWGRITAAEAAAYAAAQDFQVKCDTCGAHPA